MAAADELLGLLGEKRQDLVDQPARLGAAQPRRAHKVCDETFELGQLQHPQNIPVSEVDKQEFYLISGRIYLIV